MTLSGQTTGTVPEKLYRIRVGDLNRIRDIERKGVVVYNSKPGEYIDVEATPEEIRNLGIEGAEIEFLADNFSALFPMAPELKTAPGFHNYAATNAELLSVHNTYPAITRLDTIGRSVAGRYILCLKISDNPDADEDETPMLFIGNHHGNEVHSVEIALADINYLVSHYGTDPEVTNWVNNMEIWFLPMMNPDGREAMRRSNDHFVDLNRNYSFAWQPDIAYGTGPFSEPENRAIRDFAAKFPPVMSISYHTSGQYVLYSWTHTDAGAPDSSALAYIGGLLADSITVVTNGRTESYTLRQGGRWYFTPGEYDDYMYVTHNTMAYTVELGISQSPDYTVVPAMITGNLRGFRTFMRQAWKAGVTGRVTDAFTGLPVRATIDIPSINNQGLLPPRQSDSLWGRYYRYLQPGDYTFQISAPGFRTIVRTLTISPDSLVHWDIQMERSATLKVKDVMVIDKNSGAASGNGDGFINLGEKIGFSISLDNQQSVKALAAYAKLSSESPYVQFLDDYLTFGDIDGNQVKFASDTALFRIDPACPDGEKPEITVSIGDAVGFGWIEKVQVEVRAPRLTIGKITIDDSVGNGNGAIDNGETAVVRVGFVNQGRQGIHAAEAIIGSNDPWFQVISGQDGADLIAAGETKELGFTVSLSAGAPKGYFAAFTADVTSAEGYAASLKFDLNNILGFYDDFEDGVNGWTHNTYGTTSNSHDDWQLGTPAGKNGDPGSGFSGLNCWGNDQGWDEFAGTSWDGLYQNNEYNWLKSPAIDCSGLSGVGLKFMRWLTIRTGDHARIKVNGQLVWESPQFGLFDSLWTPQLIDISAVADHNPSVRVVFELESNSTGTAGGWTIDDFIVADGLAGGASAVETGVMPEGTELYDVKPNPVTAATVVRYRISAGGPVDLAVYNQSGVRIKTLINSTMPAGNHEIAWNMTGSSGRPVPPGIYLVRLRAGEVVTVKRVVVIE